MWYVAQCPELGCSRYMITKGGTIRKKCPYCNRSFKVNDHFIKAFNTQDEAREHVKFYNSKI